MSKILFAIIIFLVATAQTTNPYRVDVTKISAHAAKSGYTSATSEHNTSKYFGTKNLDNIKIEQAYEIHYGGEKHLSVLCKTCLTKNIPPKEHALCRAEFSKLHEAVYGKRPDFKDLPYELTPAEGQTVKTFGEGNRYQIKVALFKNCGESGKQGYQFKILDLYSIANEEKN